MKKRILVVLISSTVLMTSLGFVRAAELDNEEIVAEEIMNGFYEGYFSDGEEIVAMPEDSLESDVMEEVQEIVPADVPNEEIDVDENIHGDGMEVTLDIQDDVDVYMEFEVSSDEDLADIEVVEDTGEESTTQKDELFIDVSDGTEIINEETNFIGDYTYIVENEKAIITGYTGTETDLVIPSEIDGYVVERIDDYTFYGCSYLNNVKIPESVTYIGEKAFSNCDSLKEIVIPGNVEMPMIDCYIFSECDNLESVKFLEGIKKFGTGLFKNCVNLSNVELPRSLIDIGTDTFSGCTGLEEIYLPEHLEEMGNNVFYGCTALSYVEIPDSVTKMYGSIFQGCINLTEVILPADITDIGSSTFWGCKKLKTIELPEGIIRISDHFFVDCAALEAIDIPEGVTHIGYGAFSGCRSLKDVCIPDSVTSIGTDSFSTCISLESIKLPDSIVNIPFRAFGDCQNLKEVRIPENVTSIGAYAFEGCTSLEYVNIPVGVTSIEEYTFNRCSNLKEITIPHEITGIGRDAFCECTSLLNIVIPSKVKKIDRGAFFGCVSLEKIYFKGGAPYASDYIFGGVSAKGYYPITNTTWTSDQMKRYGGTIIWKGIYYDDYEYSDGLSSIYTEEDWQQWIQMSDKMIQYLCNSENFLHVMYISENDGSVLGRFEYLFTNFIDIGKGWNELLNESVSQQMAEEILYTLLSESDTKIKELSEAKIAKSVASMLAKTLDKYLTSEGYDAFFENGLYHYTSSEIFQKHLTKNGLNAALDELLVKAGADSDEHLKKIIEDFKVSNTLKNGLKGLGIGLELIDLGQVSFDQYVKYLELKEANIVYKDLLVYIKENTPYVAIANAADALLSRMTIEESKVVEVIAVDIAGKKMTSYAFKQVIRKVWFLEAAKIGMDAGKLLSNYYFHTMDIVELKNSMRVAAYIGESIAGWTKYNYNLAVMGNMDVDLAENVLYGMECMARVRKLGEISLKNCAYYLRDYRAEKLAVEVIATIDSYIDHIKIIKEYDLQMMKVPGPVDVEIYDNNGNLVLTVYDGKEYSGQQGDIKYYTYLSKIKDDYMKTIFVPENSGYYYKIKGTDLGSVSCYVSEINNDGSTKVSAVEQIPINTKTQVIVEKTDDIQNVAYTIIEKEEIKEKGILSTQNISDTVMVTGIELLTPENISMILGEKNLVSCHVFPDNATNKNISWSTSNAKVVSVGKDGVIKALSEGSAVITATSEDGKYQVSCTVNVKCNHQYEVVGEQLVCHCGDVYEGNGLVDVNDKKYYLVSNKLVSGWQFVDADIYYFDPISFAGVDGEQYTEDAIKFTFDNGRVTNGTWVKTRNGMRYWYGPDYYKDTSADATSSRPYEIDGKTYLFNRQGYMQTGITHYMHTFSGTSAEVWYYDCGVDGVATLYTGPYNDYFYRDGVKEKCYKLVQDNQGDYYFISDGHKLAKNCTIYLANRFVEGHTYENGTPMTAGYYTFDAEGKMVVKNGLIDGYLYVNGVKQTAYKLFNYNDDYYFINDGHKVAVDTTIYLTSHFVEGHTYEDGTPMTAGYYTFDAEGRMIGKNGPINGYFYRNGVQLKAYQLVEYDGNYYFISDYHKILINTKIWLSAKYVSGKYYADESMIEVGYHYFDETGKMVY